ncbi:pyridoxal-phosphate dependent enzyme [Caulobacter segnis]
MGGRDVPWKPETLQRAGPSSSAAAYNRLSQLSDAERGARGVVAFSSGSHAQGVALPAARLLEIPALIVMHASAHLPAHVKVEGTRGFGAEIRFYDRFTEDPHRHRRPDRRRARLHGCAVLRRPAHHRGPEARGDRGRRRPGPGVGRSAGWTAYCRRPAAAAGSPGPRHGGEGSLLRPRSTPEVWGRRAGRLRRDPPLAGDPAETAETIDKDAPLDLRRALDPGPRRGLLPGRSTSGAHSGVVAVTDAEVAGRHATATPSRTLKLAV